MESNVAGASVLVCAYHEWYRVWYCLLGRERDGHYFNSGRMSDFGGGRRKRTEKNSEETASREFVEETLCLCSLVESQDVTRQSCLDLLNNKHYLYKVTHVNEHNGSRFVTYVVRVALDPHIPTLFRSMREKLLKVRYDSSSLSKELRTHPAVRWRPDRQTRKQYYVNTDWLEKSDLRWVDMKYAASEDGAREMKTCGSFHERMQYIVNLPIFRNRCDLPWGRRAGSNLYVEQLATVQTRPRMRLKKPTVTTAPTTNVWKKPPRLYSDKQEEEEGERYLTSSAAVRKQLPWRKK